MKDLIADLRGGYPEHCDFCGEKREPAQLIPDEGGEWSCVVCWDRWEKANAPVQE